MKRFLQRLALGLCVLLPPTFLSTGPVMSAEEETKAWVKIDAESLHFTRTLQDPVFVTVVELSPRQTCAFLAVYRNGSGAAVIFTDENADGAVDIVIISSIQMNFSGEGPDMVVMNSRPTRPGVEGQEDFVTCIQALETETRLTFETIKELMGGWINSMGVSV